MASQQLASERRELKQQQQRAVADAVPLDTAFAWADPMAADEDRIFAQDRRTAAMQAAHDVSESRRRGVVAAPTFGKQDTRTIKEQRESLPIFGMKEALLSAVAAHRVLVVIGETGSGKTTQMTQYLAEAGYTARGRIGCTQPRCAGGEVHVGISCWHRKTHRVSSPSSPSRATAGASPPRRWPSAWRRSSGAVLARRWATRFVSTT